MSSTDTTPTVTPVLVDLAQFGEALGNAVAAVAGIQRKVAMLSLPGVDLWDEIRHLVALHDLVDQAVTDATPVTPAPGTPPAVVDAHAEVDQAASEAHAEVAAAAAEAHDEIDTAADPSATPAV